jgi:hypothetical protein
LAAPGLSLKLFNPMKVTTSRSLLFVLLDMVDNERVLVVATSAAEVLTTAELDDNLRFLENDFARVEHD